MIHALWFAAKIAVLVGLAVWLAEQPGVLSFSWQDYNIRMNTGTALVGILFAVLALLLLYKAFLRLSDWPMRYKRWRQEKTREKGYRAVTLGLSAVAAGDAKLAHYHATRSQKLIPQEKELTTLLAGQAAYLRGEESVALQAFKRLLKNKDTAFLGLRGLLTSALDRRDYEEAEALIEQALKLYPRQPWILKMAYDLELRRQDWNKAYTLAYQCEKHNALPSMQARRDRIVLLLKQAEDLTARAPEKADESLKLMTKAYNMDRTFMPSALRLTRHYRDLGKMRKVRKIIETIWKEEPHPAFVQIWKDAAPQACHENDAKMLHWIEKLVSMNPQHYESQMAAAEEAIRQHLWGQARQYLEMAETLYPDARLYRLRAHMEDIQGHPEEARHWLEKAQDAQPEKTWICLASGQIYDDWAPLAMPHGSFNTIIWGHPHQAHPEAILSAQRNLLMTSPLSQMQPAS